MTELDPTETVLLLPDCGMVPEDAVVTAPVATLVAAVVATLVARLVARLVAGLVATLVATLVAALVASTLVPVDEETVTRETLTTAVVVDPEVTVDVPSAAVAEAVVVPEAATPVGLDTAEAVGTDDVETETRVVVSEATHLDSVHVEVIVDKRVTVEMVEVV